MTDTVDIMVSVVFESAIFALIDVPPRSIHLSSISAAGLFQQLKMSISEKIAVSNRSKGALRIISQAYRSEVMKDNIDDSNGRSSVRNRHSNKNPSFKK